MSSNITDPKDTTATEAQNVASPNSKGKGKAPDADVSMEEDEEEEEEEDDDEDDEEEEEEEEEEESLAEIDPAAIVGRRTRGRKVDYSSSEALEKAGLTRQDLEEDDEMKE